MSILTSLFGLNGSAMDLSISESALKEQMQKLALTRKTLQMKRDRFYDDWKRLTSLDENINCKSHELSLNLMRAQSKAQLWSSLDNFIGFFRRMEVLYDKILNTRHQLEVLKKTMHPEQFQKLQMTLGTALNRIRDAEDKIRDMEAQGKEMEDSIKLDNDHTFSFANAEVEKVIEAIKVCRDLGDTRGLAENQAKYDELMKNMVHAR